MVEIVSIIITQYEDKKEAIAFLEKIETKVKINDEALALCKVYNDTNFLIARRWYSVKTWTSRPTRFYIRYPDPTE